MKPAAGNDQEFMNMVADYMEKGFLDNIIDMFKHDESLYGIIPHLLSDERLRVRLGTTALLETLNGEDGEKVQKALPHLIGLLKHPDPNVRGDSVSLIGVIARSDVTEELEPLLSDANPDVRMLAKEAIEDIKKRIDGGSTASPA